MTAFTKPPKGIEIIEWDTDLPVGDWSGPDPFPLLPSKGVYPPVSDDDWIDFRVRSIEFAPSADQQSDIQAWVRQNVPQEMQWLCVGLDHYIEHLPKTLFGLAQAQIGQDDRVALEHPEILSDGWQKKFDAARIAFITFLEQSRCRYQLSGPEDLLDSGQTVHNDRERPPLLGQPDLVMEQSNPTKYLWRYLDLSKFVMLLQQRSVWFSKPQFFDDPYEFSMDSASQRAAIGWRLNGFRDAYNRAVQLGQDSYLASVTALIDGLPKDRDGRLIPCRLRLSQLSPALLSSIRKSYRDWQQSFVISCWRYAENENVAMWSQYASMDAGIAVVADPAMLRRALKPTFPK